MNENFNVPHFKFSFLVDLQSMLWKLNAAQLLLPSLNAILSKFHDEPI